MDGGEAMSMAREAVTNKRHTNVLTGLLLLGLSTVLNNVLRSHYKMDSHWAEIAIFSLFYTAPTFIVGYLIGVGFRKGSKTASMLGFAAVVIHLLIDVAIGRISIGLK